MTKAYFSDRNLDNVIVNMQLQVLIGTSKLTSVDNVDLRGEVPNGVIFRNIDLMASAEALYMFADFIAWKVYCDSSIA